MNEDRILKKLNETWNKMSQNVVEGLPTNNVQPNGIDAFKNLITIEGLDDPESIEVTIKMGWFDIATIFMDENDMWHPQILGKEKGTPVKTKEEAFQKIIDYLSNPK